MLRFECHDLETRLKILGLKEKDIERRRKGGLRSYEMHKGIHALTSEEHSSNGLRGASKGGKTGGRIAYQLCLGVHALNSEQHSLNGKKGGEIGGRLSFERKKGIHSLTSHERSYYGKISGALSVISRGQVPYTTTERETEFGLMNEKDYITTLKFSGGYDSECGWQEIADKVNKVYSNSRTAKKLNNIYSFWKISSNKLNH
ncbi:MAG: hypothetical protein AABW41_03815 [Nanoarchaeota archaeon]